LQKNLSREPINKIIFLSYLPLTIQNEKIIYVPEFLKAGLEVEYWDVSSLFFDVFLSDSIDQPYVRSINNYHELKKYIREVNKSDVLFIIYIAYEFRTIRLYRILSKHNCIMGQFDRSGFPTFQRESFKSRFIKKILTIKLYPQYIGQIISILNIKFGFVKSPHIVFAAGTEAIERNRGSSVVIPVNYNDYDNFLELDSASSDLLGYNYCVFLDEYLPYHPDIPIVGLASLDPEKYFKEMNSLFDKIEANLGLRVVIACHPKSDYTENPFNGRPLFKYKTMTLVKHSKLIVMHESTSISYAIIYRKPILFVYTEQYAKIYKDSGFVVMKNISEYLGVQMMDINDSLRSIEEFSQSIDKKKYDSYKNNCLTTSETRNQLSSTVITNFLLGY